MCLYYNNFKVNDGSILHIKQIDTTHRLISCTTPKKQSSNDLFLNVIKIIITNDNIGWWAEDGKERSFVCRF